MIKLSDIEFNTLIGYLESLGPADMRDGTYDVKLTLGELETIVEALEEYKIG